MINNLTPEQCRVIGVLLEKEITTPDLYPLSLNALTNGCNQKSNREPVMSLSESDVQNTVDELVAMKLVSNEGAFTGRVEKYKHRFCNTEFGSFKLSQQQLAIVCVMLLRGAQTPGELRTRTNRLAEFANVSEVEQALTELQALNGEAVVVRLEREPGKREARYGHLFSGQPSVAVPAGSADSTSTDDSARVNALETQVQALTAQVQELSRRLDELGG